MRVRHCFLLALKHINLKFVSLVQCYVTGFWKTDILSRVNFHVYAFVTLTSSYILPNYFNA